MPERTVRYPLCPNFSYKNFSYKISAIFLAMEIAGLFAVEYRAIVSFT